MQSFKTECQVYVQSLSQVHNLAIVTANYAESNKLHSLVWEVNKLVKSSLREKALFIVIFWSWHGLWSSRGISETEVESLQPEGSQLLLVNSYTVAQRYAHLGEARLLSSQCAAALGEESLGQRCRLNPGHIMCSANLLVVSLARTWGCAHVHRFTYAFHLPLCGSRHSSCFSCVGSVIYSGSCIVQCCLQ